MATPFGKYVRIERIKMGISLLEMAQDLGVTSSYLSGMETGRKKITQQRLGEVAEYLKLNREETERLSDLAEKSQPETRISHTKKTTDLHRDVIHSFARNFDNLNEAQLNIIKRCVEE